MTHNEAADFLKQRYYRWIDEVLPERLQSYEKYLPHISEKLRLIRDNFFFAKGGIMLVCGNSGSGKTSLASEVIAKFLWHRVKAISSCPAIYINSHRFFLGIRDAMTDFKNSELSFLKPYEQVELLVIDDIGGSHYTDYEFTHLQNLLILREQNVKKTLLISNMSTDMLQSTLPEPILRRVNESFGVIELIRS